jgi:hypothetical protein
LPRARRRAAAATTGQRLSGLWYLDGL